MKTTKSYSIEESIYNAFDSLTTEKNINKSSFFEEVIRKFLKDNDMDFVDKLYSLKTNPGHVVTVVSQDSTYYILNDGSRIQKILFMQIFKECDSVDPEKFFNKTNPFLEKIVEKIKNIDESKIKSPELKEDTFFDDISHKIFSNDEIIKRQNISRLIEIDKNFRTGKYLTSDIKEICYDLIDLLKLNFNTHDGNYDLQQFLIKNLTSYKNDWWKNMEVNL